jgi:hypothetical protein
MEPCSDLENGHKDQQAVDSIEELGLENGEVIIALARIHVSWESVTQKSTPPTLSVNNYVLFFLSKHWNDEETVYVYQNPDEHQIEKLYVKIIFSMLFFLRTAHVKYFLSDYQCFNLGSKFL